MAAVIIVLRHGVASAGGPLRSAVPHLTHFGGSQSGAQAEETAQSSGVWSPSPALLKQSTAQCERPRGHRGPRSGATQGEGGPSREC